MSERSGKRRRRVAVLLVALVSIVVAGLLAARVILAGASAFEEGAALEARGESAGACLAYREAISWYFPGSPYVTRAIERMWALADAAETSGDVVGARIIVGDLRSALFSIRWIVQPHAEELSLASERLALLLALTDERVRAGALSAEAMAPRYRAAVARDHAPSVGWSLALGLGFLLWIGGTTVAIVRLVPDDGAPLQWRHALPWSMVSVCSLVLWLCGAAFA